jgi:hypothetical protein
MSLRGAAKRRRSNLLISREHPSMGFIGSTGDCFAEERLALTSEKETLCIAS